jgi:hypothetical protein
MKSQNVVVKQSMLLKLKLIKTKIFNKKNVFVHLKMEDVECRLKKGLQVIYKYHANDKKILFVGNCSLVEEVRLKKLLKHTKHMFIPEYLLLNGTIYNKQLPQSYFSNYSSSYKILQLKYSVHLIIKLSNLIKICTENDLCKSKIPVIVLDTSINTFDAKVSYKILGNFIRSKKKMTNNLFLALLGSFLTKTIKRRLLI